MFSTSNVMVLFFGVVQIHASQYGDEECKPVVDASMANANFLTHRGIHKKVLIATPIKNAAHTLPHFAEALRRLTYPKAYLSVAFLVSDSIDGTEQVAQGLKESTLHDFASLEVFAQDFHYEAPADRHAYEVQATRRAVLAKSRNSLIQKALKPDTFAVIWLDVDITGFPRALVQDMLGMGRPVVAPHVLIGPVTYDRNSWRENKPEEAFQAGGPTVVFEGYPETALAGGHRSYMDDLRSTAMRMGHSNNRQYAVCIDGVGTAVLFVEARVHRSGVLFPEVPYKKRLESEGFGLWAKDRGFQPCGLPFYEVYHVDEWAKAETSRKLKVNSLNKTRSKTERVCQPWCRSHDAPWTKKCAWNQCAGCPLCSKDAGCAAQCAHFRNGATGAEEFLCVGPSEAGGHSPCYPPSNGKCDGNMPRCETQTSAIPAPAGASDGNCTGPPECSGKKWMACRDMEKREGKCKWKTLPSRPVNATAHSPEDWECTGSVECAGKEMKVCRQLQQEGKCDWALRQEKSPRVPAGECTGAAECAGKDLTACQQIQRQEGKCKWEVIKPGQNVPGECVGRAECDDKDKTTCRQMKREGKCAWVPAPSQRKTPTGNCLGLPECMGKTRRICHRMRQQEGKCRWKPHPANEVKVKITIKNVTFAQMDPESKEELRNALQTTIADKAGVDETAVNVTLTAGSVKVSAVIDLEERIGIMESESEGQNLDLVQEMEALKDEARNEMVTGDAKSELLEVAASIEGVQSAAEGEITITDPEASMDKFVPDSFTTQTPSVDSSTSSSVGSITPEDPSKARSSEQEPVHAPASATTRYNAFGAVLVASIALWSLGS